MSSIKLIYDSSADPKIDFIVNAADAHLLAGGGICGVIFKKVGMTELQLHSTHITISWW